MVYKPLKFRPRIKTQNNGSYRPNSKKGGLRTVKSVQRLHLGRNLYKMHASQESSIGSKGTY